MQIMCGDDECTSVQCRDYETIDRLVSLIIYAVEKGFDTHSDDGYELFASEGLLGDPDDLTHYQYLHARSQVFTLAEDAIYYMENYT